MAEAGSLSVKKPTVSFDAPVTNRQQTIASFHCLARCGGACNTRVSSNKLRGTLRDSPFGTVQRRDLDSKSFREFYDLPGDAEADRIDIQ